MKIKLIFTRLRKGMVHDMEYTKKKLTVILTCICLIVCVGLVIIGHESVSYQGLSIMLAGLCGILLLLYLYNRKFK